MNEFTKKTEASMKGKMQSRKRKILIWILSLSLSLAVIVGGCAIYVGDYYHADEEAIAAFAIEGEVEQRTLEDGSIVFLPEKSEAGLIFYPGGKVEHTAYVPLMRALAARGVLCVLIEMPCRLAVLDMNAADGVQDAFPEIDRWYIGGHSLGGSMAASYVAKHETEFEGLILLASYSTADLSDSALTVLSIYGSEDGVMNREKYESYKENLPADLSETVIEGGCHAYFGMYGAQIGDGVPRIETTDQIEQTVQTIVAQTILQPKEGK